jgi:hypothetical protein
MENRPLPATFASPTGPRDSLSACGFPTDAIGTGSAALPAGMRLAPHELRLPFGHAPARAEEPLTVKVACGPTEFLTTPLTDAHDLTALSEVRLSSLRLGSAFQRAISLLSLAGTLSRLAANSTDGTEVVSPTGFQIACHRAITLVGPTVLRVIRFVAVFAVARLFAFHALIIPQQIEERYCEIAAKRLQQSVMRLEAVV